MTACVGKGLVRRIFRWGLPMLAVGALALGAAGASLAQSQSEGAAQSAPAAKPAAPAAQKPAPAPSRANGLNTGITVHGHWVIEVKNPDGSLVRHVEFENSLVPGGGNGANFLSSILSRSITLGSWRVVLENENFQSYIIVNEPNSGASSFCATLLSQFNAGALAGVNALSCSSGLSVAGGISPQGAVLTTLTLSGSGLVPTGFGASIDYVETDSFLCTPSSSPTACLSGTATPAPSPNAAFTARMLDGNNGDPAAVPVSVGQTVQVTVTISFSSGS